MVLSAASIKHFLASIGRESVSGDIPEPLFMLFQMTFAIITPALIICGFAEQMKFSAVLIFSSAWLLLVYAPLPIGCGVAAG